MKGFQLKLLLKVLRYVEIVTAGEGSVMAYYIQKMYQTMYDRFGQFLVKISYVLEKKKSKYWCSMSCTVLLRHVLSIFHQYLY